MVTKEGPAARGKLELLVRYSECGEPRGARKAFKRLPKGVSRAGPGCGVGDEYHSKFAVKRANPESERALPQTHR